MWYNENCRLCKALNISPPCEIAFAHSEPNLEREVLFVFAVVKIGGKQYKVQEGDIVFVEKLKAEEGETVEFAEVLSFSDGESLTIGCPTVPGASVGATVVKHGKDKKIYVITYKSKKNEKKKIGHRQPHTKIQIKTIAIG